MNQISPPEIRTRPVTAIALSVGVLVSVPVGILGGSKLEDLLDSASAASVLIALWLLTGIAAAIAAIVDAYIRPEGERLSLATSIAATVFVILGLVVVSGVVAGAADLGSGAAEIRVNSD